MQLALELHELPTPRWVVHCKHAPYDVYIGRGACPVTGKYYGWGNPFSHLPHSKGTMKVATRQEAVTQYQAWLYGQPELLALVKRELKGKVLGCWCAPELCHGEVLAQVANSGAPVSWYHPSKAVRLCSGCDEYIDPSPDGWCTVGCPECDPTYSR